jgi:hypothetical protein
VSLLDTLQRRVDPAYRARMEAKERFIELRQASFEAYLAGEISQEAHESRVAELRQEYLVDHE